MIVLIVVEVPIAKPSSGPMMIAAPTPAKIRCRLATRCSQRK